MKGTFGWTHFRELQAAVVGNDVASIIKSDRGMLEGIRRLCRHICDDYDHMKSAVASLTQAGASNSRNGAGSTAAADQRVAGKLGFGLASMFARQFKEGEASRMFLFWGYFGCLNYGNGV